MKAKMTKQDKRHENDIRIVTGAIMLASAQVLQAEFGFTPDMLARWAELTAVQAAKGVPGAVTVYPVGLTNESARPTN